MSAGGAAGEHQLPGPSKSHPENLRELPSTGDLSEMQAGLLVSISFPDHCDALALFNAVYAVATA